MSIITSPFGIVVSAIMTTASLVIATAQRANQRAVVAVGVLRLPGQHPNRGLPNTRSALPNAELLSHEWTVLCFFDGDLQFGTNEIIFLQ